MREYTSSVKRVKGRKHMNFNDKNIRRIASVLIIIIVVAMVLTMVLPYIA